MNLLDSLNRDREMVINELRKGNTEAVKALTPAEKLSYGLEMGRDYVEASPIDPKEVEKAMVRNLRDSGVKEMLLKKIEED